MRTAAVRFAAVHSVFLRSPVALAAPSAAVGTWTRLYVRAAELERAGLIPGAAALDDRGWLVSAGVTRTEVDAAVTAGLCTWKGPALEVHGYDLAGQRAVEAKRRFGKTGGRPRKSNDISTGKPDGFRNGKPLSLPLLSSPSRSEQIAADAATFEALWAGCSRKGGKAEARKAWVKAGKPAAEDVIARWAKYVASLEEWRNPKDVATWFNKGVWLEEYVPYVKPGSNGHAKPAEDFAQRDARARREAGERKQRELDELNARAKAALAGADAEIAAKGIR